MYTPSTTARSGTHSVYSRNSYRTKEPSEYSAAPGSVASSVRTKRSARSASSVGSARPSTSEVLLAKKQLKLEGMIRKLLVQQQESDSTIADLTEALSRLDPAERDRINLHDMTAAVRDKNGKGGKQLGIQYLNGSPQQGSLRRSSPWHLKREEQDISHSLHPEQHNTSRSLGKTKAHLQLDGRNTKSLLAPASLFSGQDSRSNSQWNITSSPNNNPSNILSYQKDKYCAPSIPKHFDSSKIGDSISKWGSDEQSAAWESSPDRWQTHTEDVHGGPKLASMQQPLSGKLRPQSAMNKSKPNRPSSALSNTKRSFSSGKTHAVGRPVSAMSRVKKSRPTTAKTRGFGDTDPELQKNPSLWTGSGYVKNVYQRLGQQNSEMHGRTAHDPELIPGAR